MSIFDRGLRGNVQSPFSSALDASTTAYTNSRLVGDWNGNVKLALDFLLDAVYPNYKGTVATKAALPGTATANDFYIVVDDGDGKSAGYVYSIIQGVTQWIKRYDVDWSYEQILADTITRTSYMYAAKYGATDKDAAGAAVAGTYAGQRIYGGDLTTQNLSLTANAVDATGYVQSDNTLRATSTNALDLGTSSLKWRTGYFGTSVLSGTATLSGGSLVDSSGALSFGTTNLSATGTLASGTHTVSTTLILAAGNIHDSSGALSFGSNNLSTTGTLGSGVLTAATGSVLADITFTNGTFNTASSAFSFSSKNVGTIGTLSATTVTGTTVNAGNLTAANQTLTTTSGALILQSVAGGNATTVQINSKAQLNNDLAVTGLMTVGTAVQIQTSSSNAQISSLLGDIQLVPTGNISAQGKIVPDANNTRDLGTTALRFANLYLGTAIGDGTNTISMATLMSLRGINTSVATGNVLAWNGTQWAPEATAGVIDHTTLTNLTTTDAGHTQFALLAGRAGTQTLIGGTASGQSLTLESTAHATKGFVLVSSSLAVTTDATYSAGWLGTDLGGSSRNFRDIYSKGIHYGLRLDQYAGSGAYPANSGQNVGRAIWDTTLNKLMIDNGTTWSPALPSTLTNPMTTGGDIIYGGSSGTPTRLANGTSGQVVQSAGSTSAPTWATLPGNATALKAPTTQVFTSGAAATYTTPTGPGPLYLEVIIIGGGAGGGGANSGGLAGGGGGGGGGVCVAFIASPSATYTYTVGASAAGGTAGNPGTAGNLSKFNGTTYQATGGTQGTASSSATVPGLGGAGGVGSGGFINGSGSGGSAGIPGVSGVSNGPGGAGGGTAYGGGGAGNSSGAAGLVYGGGGGGGSSTTAGGAGAAGVIIVKEHYQ